MARSATAQKTRAPQGAKRVAQAFLDELDTISEEKQAEVGKAAQGMIREALMMRKEKARAANAKSRATAKNTSRGRGATPAGREGSSTARPRRPRPSRLNTSASEARSGEQDEKPSEA